MSSTGCADKLRYEYVRLFEQPDALLANTWIVVRIDGRGFSKYVVICIFSITEPSCHFPVSGTAGTRHMRKVLTVFDFAASG
jgi:hypothetical protein